MEPPSKLYVRVVEARNLAKPKGDIYCVVEVQRQKKKTQAVRGSHPTWGAAFSFDVREGAAGLGADDGVVVSVWAKEVFKDELLGMACVALRPLPADWASFALPLERRPAAGKGRSSQGNGSGHGKPAERSAGELLLQVRHGPAGHGGDDDSWVLLEPVHPPPHAAAPAPASPHAPAPAPAPAVAAAAAEAERLNRALREAEEAERRRQEAESDRLFQEFLRSEYVCDVCRQPADPDAVFAVGPSCPHKACARCLGAHAPAAARGKSQREGVACPVATCAGKLSDGVLMRVLPAEEFDAYIARGLDELVAHDSGGHFFRCPKCHLVMEKMAQPAPPKQPEQLLGPDGLPLGPEAAAHRNEFRFRCRSEACSAEFCAACQRTPYHLGYTCAQYDAYLASRHCRFCQSPLPPALASPAAAGALADVCAAPECVAKRDAACAKLLPCGHACGGVRDEAVCLPCLRDGCSAAHAGQSGSDFCNICWVEELAAAPSLLLQCGHVFHAACLLKKLRERWPSARITFGFMNCPLCKQRIAHPALADELKPLLALYDDIRGKALQRLEFEGLKNDPDVALPSGRYHGRPGDYAMDKFAYYPCYQCKRPYFGGQRRCDAGEQNRPFDPKDLICGSCAGGALATTCEKHGKDYIEYKCQYCCAIATWFCWGKTHFCEDCHTRQQKGDYVSKKPKSELPVCPGPEKCPLKRRHPPNGEEFSFGCVLCANEREF